MPIIILILMGNLIIFNFKIMSLYLLIFKIFSCLLKFSELIILYNLCCLFFLFIIDVFNIHKLKYDYLVILCIKCVYFINNIQPYFNKELMYEVKTFLLMILGLKWFYYFI